MLKEKKRNIIFFGVIFLIFGSILLFLFSFNSGLEFKQTATKEVIITNNSMHLIRNIKIYVNDKLIKEINSLKPKEEKIIDLSEFNGIINLKATAEFHVSIEKTINLSAEEELILNIKLSMPEPLPLNSSSAIALEICNQGKTINNMQVILQADKTILDLDKNYFVISIKENDCSKINFNLIGLKETKTMLIINLIVRETKREFVKEITISG